jgi:hypothetical protein
LLASLLLLAIGIGSAWGRSHMLSLLPLFVLAGYSLSNAISIVSGWRFNLPVDWVGTLYYAIGLIQVCFWGGTFLANRFVPRLWEAGSAPVPIQAPVAGPFPWKRAFLVGLAFFILAAAIPLAERLIPERYPPGAVQTTLAAEASAIDPAALQDFLSGENAVILVGRAMYPRFYPAGDGIPRAGWPSYATRDYPRLGFVLVGPQTTPVVWPGEQPPLYFPNGSDVLVVGCERADHIEARLVALLDAPQEALPASLPGCEALP